MSDINRRAFMKESMLAPAAGAIPPANAFPYVFQNGADHVLAGMFDFEIAEDVAIANKALAAVKKRPRP